MPPRCLLIHLWVDTADNRSLSYFHHHIDYWTGVYPQCEGSHCEGDIGYFDSCLAAAALAGLDPTVRPVDLWEHDSTGAEGPVTK